MDEEGAGASSPSRVACCGCRFLRSPIKPAEGRRRAQAGSSSSTDSGPFKAESAGARAAEKPATLKPHLTGRRSRSDSPKSEGEAEEQPVKRQNSMGQDDPAIGSPTSGGSSVQPMDEAVAARVPAAPTATASSSQGVSTAMATQQHTQMQQQQPILVVNPATMNACPPFGSKSVIGRRAKMEDACVAVPYLVEVPVGYCGMHELLPPRIAPQLRGGGAGGTSAFSDQMGAPAPSGDTSSSAAPGSSEQQQQQQQAAEPGAGAMALDPISSSGGGGGPSLTIATETLHFFGVFDGHGGADAALHCAKSLHERVRAVLSTCVASPGVVLSPRSKEHGGGGAGQTVAQPTAGPQASSSGGDIGQRPSGGGGDDAASSRSLPASSGGSEYQDASGALNYKGSGSSSSNSANSYLDTDFDAQSVANNDNSVQGLSCTAETIEAALTKAFHITDEEFGNMGGYEHLALVGTTAVVALVGNRMIYVANCGDSRAVLCRSGGALPLTDDHKAAREDETARVEAAGGQILFWNGVRVMGLLAVSRAIGDHSLRPYVIAEPEVTIIARHPSDEVLVMASDGLWDVMSNQEAVTLAKKCLGRARSRGSTRQSAARVAATVLTRAAVDRGSRDNVTVVIVDLSPMTVAEMEVEAQLSERSEAAIDERTQRARSIQPSAVAVRSSTSASSPIGVQGSGPHPTPPVQMSPFAGAAVVPTAPSPFADPPSAVAVTMAQVAAPATAPAAGPATLVSPFSSGVLPAGLDFDVRQHANAVAAAAAATAASSGGEAAGQPTDGDADKAAACSGA